jgi:Family of unknown function (DUF5994)
MLGTTRPQLGEGLDGAWWPHTASVAHELPELIGALSGRLGEIFDISINWSSLEGSPDLDAVKRARMANPIRVTSHQRLMMITGSQCSANLLVVPSRTSSATLCAPRVLKAHCSRNASGELDSRTSIPQIQSRQFDTRRATTLRWANVVARHDINLREPRCAPTMLTSPLPARLLEGVARKIAVSCRGTDSPLESVCVYPRIRGQATTRRRRGSGHPDAWVPATQLKGRDEQI